MKITVIQLRKIIREEMERLAAKEDFGHLISMYSDDPDKDIPSSMLKKKKIPADEDYDYNVVYGQIVKQDKDKNDLEYWDKDSRSWKNISDKMRHHPVSVHIPS